MTSHSHRHTRKRGGRAGALVKFCRRNLRPPFPCVFLSNDRSLKNKADELFFLIQSNREVKDCSVFCFTETWLDPSIPDSAVQPPGYTLFRADRSPDLSNKSRGGGISFFVNQRWCSDADVLSTSCSPELETLTVRCRPFYSPREFSSVILVGVYIPRQANARTTIKNLSASITVTENANPVAWYWLQPHKPEKSPS